jgi:hypothetical protein
VNIYTYTLPANTLGAGKGLRITAVFMHSTGTASTSYKWKIGATTLVTNTYAPNSAANERQTVTFFNNSGVTNAQNWAEEHLLNITGSLNLQAGINAGTSALDSTSALVIALTFNVAATDQVTPKQFIVELIQ